MLSDVWDDIGRIRHNKNKTRNANELPEKLMKRIITLFTNDGDTVVDPFCGSGTTIKACKDLNRNFIGFDLILENVEISKERII